MYKNLCGFCIAVSLSLLASLSYGIPIIPLETERLYVRHVMIEDADAIAQIALNPDVLKLTGLFPPLKTIEDVQGFIKNYLMGDSSCNSAPRYPKSWAVVEKQSGSVIGLVVFVAYLERHQRAEIAYAMTPGYWNQGYTTEACQAIQKHAFDCGLIRLYATVDPENKASERVLQKLGMAYEGLMRSYMVVNGKRVDRKMYAVVEGY